MGNRRTVNLYRETLLSWRRCEIGELLHEFVEFGDVVIDVFVAHSRIPIGRKFCIFIGRNLFASAGDVIADLVARSIITTTR